MPTVQELYRPLVRAIKALGGSGSIDEMDAKTIELLALPDSVTSVLQNPATDTRTVVEYRLAWARNRLKHAGILANSSRGVWPLRSSGISPESIDPTAIDRLARTAAGGRAPISLDASATPDTGATPDDDAPWRQKLHSVLTQSLSAAAFERLTMRVLREAGFVQVEVTGRSGDGGIDGKGIARISGVLSFHVVFQCKRYIGSVTPSQVRDFRGAMQGRADKGILITTGSFTREALREATRDGAPAIDLIDGDRLAEMLKELRLGVSTELVERITVDAAWFGTLEDA